MIDGSNTLMTLAGATPTSSSWWPIHALTTCISSSHRAGSRMSHGHPTFWPRGLKGVSGARPDEHEVSGAQ